jgi:hypothetical protein
MIVSKLWYFDGADFESLYGSIQDPFSQGFCGKNPQEKQIKWEYKNDSNAANLFYLDGKAWSCVVTDDRKFVVVYFCDKKHPPPKNIGVFSASGSLVGFIPLPNGDVLAGADMFNRIESIGGYTKATVENSIAIGVDQGPQFGALLEFHPETMRWISIIRRDERR